MKTIPIFDKRLVEGFRRSELRLVPPENLGCANELSRSNMDALALTTENCEDNTLRRSANATMDDCTPWTNDKHNLYLNHLEMSFVKQLQQSMGLLVQCSKQNEIDKNISQNYPANERDNPLSHSCTDSHNFRRVRTHCWLPAADMQESLKLHCIKKHRNGKWIVSRGLATCPEKFSASNPYEDDLICSMKEGMGQNFVNEDDSSRFNCKSRAKKLKTAVADSPGYDQIIPSRKCRKMDNSAVNNRSTLSGEECLRHECASENFETFGSLPI